MNRTSIFLFTLMSIGMYSCEETPLTGSENVQEIQNVSIEVDTLYVFGDQFVAEGTIRNRNTAPITPRWYLEMSVFRDNSHDFKFGGSNTSFNFALGNNQATGWVIRFSDSQYPASEYPDFSVGEFRVYKPGDQGGE